jgi:hypothetical protein
LRLSLNRRYITGCISYMLLIATINTIAECLRADCNILGDNKKKPAGGRKASLHGLILTLCCVPGTIFYFPAVILQPNNRLDTNANSRARAVHERYCQFMFLRPGTHYPHVT